MFGLSLENKIERTRKKLDKCVMKYGTQHPKTMKVSEKINELINKHYRKQKI